MFETWKNGDVIQILDSLSHNYWEIEVIIRNEIEKAYDNEEEQQMLIEYLREHQLSLLNKIRMVDGQNGMNYFNSYVPVFIDRNVLQGVKDTMHRVFWDTFREEMMGDEPNYARLISIIEEVKTMLYCCVPSRLDIHQEIDEQIDIQLIAQMIDNKAFDSKTIRELCMYIVNKIKSFQSEYMDEELEDWRTNLNEYIDTEMPYHEFFTFFFSETMERIEIILQDTKEAKEDPLYQALLERRNEIIERNRDD